MAVDLATIHQAMTTLDAQGLPLSAQAVWRTLQAQGLQVRRTTVQERYKEALAQRQPGAAPEDVPPVAPEDPARLALAEQIAQLQAALAALPAPEPVPVPQPWDLPGWEGTSELVSFQDRYRRAMDTPCTTYSPNDLMVIERARVQFDYYQRVHIVGRCLKRARQLFRRPPPLPGQNVDSDDARVLKADMAVIERFVGRAEAQRLLQSDEVPRWPLAG